MSIRIMQEVWEHSPFSGGTLLVLLALADSADDKLRSCFPGIESLAQKARLSDRQVKRAIADLSDAGVIVVDRNASPYKTNLYTIRNVAQWPAGDKMSPTKEDADGTFTTVGGDMDVPSDGTPMSPKPSVTSDQPSDLFGSIELQRKAREEKPKEDDKALEFWAAYPKCPRKTDRLDTLALFRKIVAGKHANVPKTDPDVIIRAVKRFAATDADPQFIAMPTTWLNKARWEQFPDPKPCETKREETLAERRDRLLNRRWTNEVVR